jgi:ubiquinone/menaquinone biosynthesis C-methylase UbiE
VPIDFQAPRNARTYSDRDADDTWSSVVEPLVRAEGSSVVDIGCGGGTYTRAWHDLGAATVTGVDSSASILGAARESHGQHPGVSFRQGDATNTGLPAACADIVWERALVHHVPNLAAVAAEAWRLLRPGGTYLIQDRTADDVLVPGSEEHPRGWFFEAFPRLLTTETGRRPGSAELMSVLAGQGFTGLHTLQFWETRRIHRDREDYLAEIRNRTGRSILHELSDSEIKELVEYLAERLPTGPVKERDRWTLWRAIHG